MCHIQKGGYELPQIKVSKFPAYCIVGITHQGKVSLLQLANTAEILL